MVTFEKPRKKVNVREGVAKFFRNKKGRGRLKDIVEYVYGYYDVSKKLAF